MRRIIRIYGAEAIVLVTMITRTISNECTKNNKLREVAAKKRRSEEAKKGRREEAKKRRSEEAKKRRSEEGKKRRSDLTGAAIWADQFEGACNNAQSVTLNNAAANNTNNPNNPKEPPRIPYPSAKFECASSGWKAPESKFRSKRKSTM